MKPHNKNQAKKCGHDGGAEDSHRVSANGMYQQSSKSDMSSSR